MDLPSRSSPSRRSAKSSRASFQSRRKRREESRDTSERIADTRPNGTLATNGSYRRLTGPRVFTLANDEIPRGWSPGSSIFFAKARFCRRLKGGESARRGGERRKRRRRRFASSMKSTCGWTRGCEDFTPSRRLMRARGKNSSTRACVCVWLSQNDGK